MELIRTTLRIEKNLKKQVEKQAFEQGVTLQSIFNEALRSAVNKKTQNIKPKKIRFYDQEIKNIPVNLTRNDFYDDPK